MISPTLCIYHGNCADGFGAAWAIRRRFGDKVRFYPGAHGKAAPECEGEDVLLVDFAYPRAQLEAMAESARSVTVLDHHKTAENDLRPLLASGRIQGEFDMDRSGAAMAWDWCFPDQERPRLIQHIQDRDLWQFRLQGTREITAVLFSHEQVFEIWDGLARALEDPAAREQLMTIGETLERKHRKDVADLIRATGRTMVIGGETVPVANVPYMFVSDAGSRMSEGKPFAACYFDTPNGRKFSLRSQPDGRDVSVIAESYGGGGHPRAAGFIKPIGWEGEDR